MRRVTGLLIALLILMGCASLGYQSTTVAVDRTVLARTLGQIWYQAGLVEGEGRALCAAKAVSPDVCARGAALLEQAKGQLERAGMVAAKPGDPGDLLRVLSQLAQVAGTLGLKLAPLAIP